MVHYLQPPVDQVLEQLRSQLEPAIRLTAGDDQPPPADTQILIAGRPKREHLAACPDLRAVIIPWSGLPAERGELMAQYPSIAVHNLHHNAAPVAELALALLFAAVKCLLPLDRKLRNHDWRPRYEPSPAVLLSGKTALILGYGAIGRRVAKFCKALDMEVLAIKRDSSSKIDENVDEIHPPAALHTLLQRANALIICLPHTSETNGWIGRDELASLPLDALLVNVGRGPVVDERALFEALQERTIRAAGLDVWYHYPSEEENRSHTLPSEYPFHELDNAVMSPHRAGATQETNLLRMTHLSKLLNAALNGRSVPNQIDLKAGY